MKELVISIVTISYNQAEFLDQCLDSIEKQRDSLIEHIVVDGGSTDSSLEILKNFKEKRKKYNFSYISEPDLGPADALNKGFDLSNGDILCFINSDDMLCNEITRKIRAIFTTRNTDILQGSGFIIDRKSKKQRFVASVPMTLSSFSSRQHVIFQPSVFFNRDVFEHVRFNISNKTCWDLEFFVHTLIKGYKITWCPYVFSKFRLYEESKSGSKNDNLEVETIRDQLSKALEKPTTFMRTKEALRKRAYQCLSLPYYIKFIYNK